MALLGPLVAPLSRKIQRTSDRAIIEHAKTMQQTHQKAHTQICMVRSKALALGC